MTDAQKTVPISPRGQETVITWNRRSLGERLAAFLLLPIAACFFGLAKALFEEIGWSWLTLIPGLIPVLSLFLTGLAILAFFYEKSVGWHHIRLDAAAGLLVESEGAPGFREDKKVRKIEDIAAVHLAAATAPGVSEKTTKSYVIALRGRDGGAIPLEILRDYCDARRRAEKIADLARLVLADTTSGLHIERQPGTLDQSLRERTAREGRYVPFPPWLQGARSRYEIDEKTHRFTVDPLQLSRSDCTRLGFATALLGAGGWLIAHPIAEFLVPIGFFGIFAGCAYLAGFLTSARAAWRKAVIEASPQGLKLTVGRLFPRTRSIPSFLLEELWLLPGKSHKGLAAGILARSDRESFTFGRGLPSTELIWMKGVIEYAVTIEGSSDLGRLAGNRGGEKPSP